MGNICCNKAPAQSEIEYDILDTRYDQAGGHADTIVFLGDTLEKGTKESEVLSYQQIFSDDEITSLTKLRPFVAGFHGAKKDGANRWKITLDNLLYEMENASYIDIKLGTSTLTQGKGAIKKVVRN